MKNKYSLDQYLNLEAWMKDAAAHESPETNSSLISSIHTHRKRRQHEYHLSTRHLLHICLVLLFSTEITSMQCDMIHFQQKRLNKDSLELLEKMGGSFPFLSQCSNENQIQDYPGYFPALTITERGC